MKLKSVYTDTVMSIAVTVMSIAVTVMSIAVTVKKRFLLIW